MKTASPSLHEQLYESLKNHEPQAIRLLAAQLALALSRLPGAYLLQKQDIEELANDALLVTLKKIGAGEFQFQNAAPVAYAIAVARRLLANWLRKKRLDTQPLEDFDVADAADFDAGHYLENKEQELWLGKLLGQLADGCQEAIRLHYFEQLRDEQVIAKKLSRYTSVDSLKNKRSQCLKKLAEMARKAWAVFPAKSREGAKSR